MVNPGFYSDSHWRFKVQFGAVDMRRRVWNGKLYNADNEVVFEWQSTLPASGEGTIDLSDAVNGNLTLEATAEQHFQVEGARPYQWALYDISEPTDPFFMAAGSPGSGRTIFEQGSTVTPIPAAILTQSSLLTYIQAKGLTSGLALCVDVGDSASLASGAAQAVTDLSGAGNHLWRGATSSAEASDPTFSGVANAKTAAEKLTVNGSQYLTSQATGALANAHKDSAKWSVVAVLKAIWDGATGWNLFGTGNSRRRPIGLCSSAFASTRRVAIAHRCFKSTTWSARSMVHIQRRARLRPMVRLRSSLGPTIPTRRSPVPNSWRSRHGMESAFRANKSRDCVVPCSAGGT
jgi:hypothetical protein